MKTIYQSIADASGEYTEDQINSILDQLKEEFENQNLIAGVFVASPEQNMNIMEDLASALKLELRPGMEHKDLNDEDIDAILYW